MKSMFGSKKSASHQSSDSTWKPSAAPRASQLRGSTIDGSVESKIRGDKKSFGRAITDGANQPLKKSQSLAPRSHVEPFDMVRRMKSGQKVDFLCTEFAWWWKIVLEEEHNCFQNVFWLLEIAVTHLKTGKGSQDILALICNTVALLYLYGYLNLTTSSPPQAVEMHGKLMTLLINFDDKEARDRSEVEMCAIDLIVKIKNAANGQFRPLYTDLQDYTSFGSMEGLASQMSALGGGTNLGLIMTSKSWFDMPDKYGFSFFWPRLVQSLDDEDEMNQVFTRVKSFLERHGESLGSTSRVQILVLIMMLREFITMRPTADVNWLCATIEAIKPYFQWPRPYSLIARQLLEDLSRECLCPGSALRRRLRLEHPDLNPAMSKEDTDRDPAMTIGDLTPGHGMVHVMFDTSSPLAQTYKEFFDLPQQSLMRTAGRASTDDTMRSSTLERSLGEGMLRSVKESIILQMLSFEYDLKSHADETDPLKLQQYSDQQIDKWYKDACRVETRVEKLKFGSFGERIAITKVVRESLMGAILSEITGKSDHSCALLRCKEEGHASALRRNSVRHIQTAPQAPPKGVLPKAQNGVPVPPPPPSPTGAPNRAPPPPPPAAIAPPPQSDGMHIQKDGFDRRYQFYIPNLDFRFWPTDSTRTSSWGSLDKLRNEKNAQAGEKRSRLRKSASHLVLGQTTGAFNVIYASELAAGGGVVEGNDDEGDVPKVPVLFFPEDVDIIEHLCEGAMDTLARSDSMSTTDLNHNDYSDNESNGDVKPVVKLVVMGDNATVHRFVLAFFAFQRLNPRLHASVRINVFLVPLQEERNDLARCLAMSDPWYQRHVFAAFSGGLNLTPRFTVPEPIPAGIAQELSMRDLLPVEKLRCLLQDYTRIATQEVPISAFECQCWTPKGSILPKRSSTGMVRESSVSRSDSVKMAEDDPPDLVIPFLTSAQIGLLVDVQLFRRGIQDSKRATDRSSDGRLRLKDVLKEESFPSTLMPYKPKELLVVAFPPTMHDEEGEKSSQESTSMQANNDGAPLTDDEKKKNRGMDLAQLAEELPEEGEAADEGPKVKKYTSLLFSNVSGCVSDEVLAEELDSLEADKVKALMQDPMFGNSPTHRDLKMHTREWGGKTAEILSLKNLKSSSFGRGDPCDQLVSSLRDDIKGADANQKAIGGVSIEGAKRTSPDGKESQEFFGIMLDGVVHGPFKRVVISPMYLGDQQTVAKVPFVTFLPQTV